MVMIFGSNNLDQVEHDATALAKKVVLYDKNGNVIDSSNKLPVDATIGSLNVDVTMSGDPKYGTISALAMNATGTIKSYTAASGDKLRGFISTGTRNGYYFLEVNGTTVLSGRANSGSPIAYAIMPIAKSLSTLDAILLRVKNESLDASGDFEGSIIIET